MGILVGIFTIFVGGMAVCMLWRRRYGLAVLPAYLCAIGALFLVLGGESEGYRALTPEDEFVESRPQEENSDGYVSSDTCKSCHPGPYHSWHASYHRTMTQLASPETVLGDFSGQVFTMEGYQFELQRRGDEFWVRIQPDPKTGVAGKIVDRRVVMMTGSHHYQVYWMDGHYYREEAPDDRNIWMLPFAYVPNQEGWIPRTSAFVRPPDLETYVHRARTWNGTCIKCHATHGEARRSGENKFAKTQAAEFGIACESCHGPAEDHIAAHREPLGRYLAHHEEGETDSSIVNPAKLNKYLGSQVCGQCHSIHHGTIGTSVADWEDNGFKYRPGDDLHVTFERTCFGDLQESTVMEGDREQFLRNYFWPDGVLRVIGREYTGMLTTPCVLEGGMSCTTCHRLHKDDADPRTMKEWADDQLHGGATSDAVCLKCHEEFGDSAAIAAHSHHGAGSSGSQCYNCHMPHTGYGLLKASRNHTLTSPSAMNTVETGRPNACNQCHLDKTLAWTATTLKDWYGQPEPELSSDEREIAASILWTLQGDAGQRALMAWSFGWEEAREASGDDWMPLYLSVLLDDPYAGVQLVAARSLKKYDGYGAITQYPFPSGAPETARDLWRNWEEAGIRSERRWLLLDKNGDYDREEFDRLLSGRDQEPVHLAE